MLGLKNRATLFQLSPLCGSCGRSHAVLGCISITLLWMVWHLIKYLDFWLVALVAVASVSQANYCTVFCLSVQLRFKLLPQSGTWGKVFVCSLSLCRWVNNECKYKQLHADVLHIGPSGCSHGSSSTRLVETGPSRELIWYLSLLISFAEADGSSLNTCCIVVCQETALAIILLLPLTPLGYTRKSHSAVLQC